MAPLTATGLRDAMAARESKIREAFDVWWKNEPRAYHDKEFAWLAFRGGFRVSDEANMAHRESIFRTVQLQAMEKKP